MDFGIAGVAAITVICYLGGMACKTTEKVKDEVIPVVCGVTGGILGVAGMYLIPEFPAGDVINAAAIGIVSGLASTGVHQVIKQVGKKLGRYRVYERYCIVPPADAEDSSSVDHRLQGRRN